MGHLKISTRLALGFGALVLLIIALGALVQWRSASEQQRLTEITQRRMPILKALNDIIDQVNSQARMARNMLIFTDAAAVQREAQGIVAARSIIDERTKTVEGLLISAKGKAIHARSVQARQEFRALNDQFIEQLRQGQKEAATALLLEKLRPVQLAYMEAINEQLDLQNQFADTARQAAEQEARAMQRDVLLAVGVAVVIAVLLSVSIIRSITRPLAQAVGAADRVASGDLAGTITVHSRDETGQLLGSLQRMQQSLVSTVSAVRRNAEGVAAASAQIASGNNDLSGRTEEQASALEETAASMEELNSTVRQNADNARTANQLALNASAVAVRGGEVVEQVVTTMQGISESSRKIADIIGVIDGIAFQTNILALNAAVEAARAGEQGRGFAVVASEVRALASRSAQAAHEIKDLIGDSVQRVEQGAALVGQAGSTMEEVVGAIRRVTDLMGEISAASSEQSQGVSQVGEAVAQMDQTTQQNAALVEEMAAAASSLSSQARELVGTVAVFRLSHESEAALLQVRERERRQSAGPARAPAVATVPQRIQQALAPALRARAVPVAPVVLAGAGAAGQEGWESF